MATLFKSVLEKYKNDVFVETGTLWGESIELALECGFKKIYSIELNPERVKFNEEKFKKEIDEGIVHIIEGDTFNVFSNVVRNVRSQATFWLDAHWDDGPVGVYKCPLPFELQNLMQHPIRTHTILIDDRRLFGQVGSTWGENINEESIINSLIDINPNYKILYEDGHVPNDVIVAKV
jgi:hypothetical protein